MRTILLAAFLAVSALGAAACGANAGDCDKACRNYYGLHYWAEWDPKIAAAPADQRDALRTKAVDEFEHRMGPELGMCVSQCSEAASTDEAKCMTNARTVADAETCVPHGEK